MALEPRPSLNWMLNVNFIAHLLRDTIAYLCSPATLPHRPRDLRAIDHVLHEVFGMLVPHVITRRLLTHGVLHQNRLVSYHVLQLLRHLHALYHTLGSLLAELGHGEDTAERLRVTVTQRLATDLKKRFPDLQTIFALKARLALVDAEGARNQLPYMEFLAVLKTYLHEFPEEFLANKIDLGKTLLTSLDRAHTHVLGAQLSVLLSAANLKIDASGQHSLLKWNAPISDESDQTQLGALLQLFTEISPKSGNYPVLRDLVTQIVLSSALFDFHHRIARADQSLEVSTWLHEFGAAPWSRVLQQTLAATHQQPYQLADRLRQLSHVIEAVAPRAALLSLVSFGALAHHATLAPLTPSRDEYYTRLVHVLAWLTRRPGGLVATALALYATHAAEQLPAPFVAAVRHMLQASPDQLTVGTVQDHVPAQFQSLLLYLAIALTQSQGRAVAPSLRQAIDREQACFEQGKGDCRMVFDTCHALTCHVLTRH
jgi:uncharacterized protein YbgA (DUF1722 family)